MIHPFAHFSAAPSPGETLSERAALLERPAAEFAAFLKSSQDVAAAPAEPASPASSDVDPSPQRAASSAAATRVVASGSSTLVQVSQEQAVISPQPAPAPAPQAPNESVPGSASSVNPAAGGLPRFPDVPDSAKYPAGPYRQAPPEYGGEWWVVSPFTGDQPWLNQEIGASSPISAASQYLPENLPQGFLEAFGEIPVHRQGESGVEFAGRLSRWKQDVEFFQRTGIPDGFDDAQVELASAAYEQWGMGRPVFYEGRYGWFARFPDSAVPEFEMDAASAVGSSHLAIARYQVRLLREGVEVAQTHPFVPPHLLPQDA
jgi:hypothetical protein